MTERGGEEGRGEEGGMKSSYMQMDNTVQLALTFLFQVYSVKTIALVLLNITQCTVFAPF